MFVSTECAPFIKTGGLADVVGSLPKCFSKENYDDKLWTVYNYLFEDDKFILEIAFWTDGSEKEIADVNAILATLIKE